MKILTQVVVVAALAAAAGGGWQYKDRLPWLGGGEAVKASAKRGGKRVVPVELGAAHAGLVTVSVEAMGTAEANDAVIITPKVTGIIKRIRFREGQRVKAGSVLVEFDAGELEAKLEEKRADRDNARRLYQRARRLLQTRNVPRARVDDLQGQLLAAEARVRADEARLAEYVVKAPFAGRLGLRRVSVGALVRPGDAMTTLDDTSRVRADFRLPETGLAHVATGQAVTVVSAAYAGRNFEGRVSTIDSRVDPVSRSIQIRTVFANRDEALKPGMFLTATLVTEVRENAVLIPEQALVSSGRERFVFTVVEGKARKVAVEVGEHLGAEVEIRAGLAVGDRVVVGGTQKIRHGSAVRPLPAAAGKPGGKPG